MKRCPKCGRDYTDDTLSFCLDDGTSLLDGPASVDEPLTAILPEAAPTSESETRVFDQPSDPGKTAILPQGGVESGGSRKKIVLAAVAGLVLIAALGIGGYFAFFGPRPAPGIGSIAVMPFVNDSGDKDAEYLSDGITDTLISSLSQIPNLNVKARSSVFRFKGKDVGVGKIGSELNVQAVLTGRVTQRSDQISLSLELVDVSTENVIWSQKYDRKQKDLIALQNEVAQDVLTRIRATLTGKSNKGGAETRTENPDAYTAYLKGLYYYNKREGKDYQKALEYFRKAVGLDPNYALPYVGISNALALSVGEDADTTRTKALEALEKAKELAPDSSEVHASLANHYYFWRMNWEKAEPEYREAIRLNPNYSTAHHWYGEALCYQGRFEECFSQFQRALEIDPLSLPIISDLGRAYFFAGRYDDAKRELQKGIELDPEFARSYQYLSQVFEETGELKKAAECLEKWESREFESAQAEQKRSELVQALRDSGANGYWRKRLEWRLKEDEARNITSSWQLANIYAKLGEKDKAFAQLELALRDKGYATPTLWVDPALDPLRSDPRFDALLDNPGLFEHAQNKRK